MALVNCPECSKEISDSAGSCPHCGAPQNAQAKTPADLPDYPTESTEKNIGIGLGIGIFLMPYIFAWFTLQKGFTGLARGLSFVWMVIVLAAMGSNHSSDTSHSKPSSNPAITVTNPKAERIIVNESCLSIAKKFDASSKYSDLQKDELWTAYDGKHFEWDLVITEVSKGMFGGYSVQAKCRGSSAFIQDIQIEYPEQYKSSVLQLEKERMYKLSGELTDFISITGLVAKGYF